MYINHIILGVVNSLPQSRIEHRSMVLIGLYINYGSPSLHHPQVYILHFTGYTIPVLYCMAQKGLEWFSFRPLCNVPAIINFHCQVYYTHTIKAMSILD